MREIAPVADDRIRPPRQRSSGDRFGDDLGAGAARPLRFPAQEHVQWSACADTSDATLPCSRARSRGTILSRYGSAGLTSRGRSRSSQGDPGLGRSVTESERVSSVIAASVTGRNAARGRPARPLPGLGPSRRSLRRASWQQGNARQRSSPGAVATLFLTRSHHLRAAEQEEHQA